jgi:hypothetical protein
VTRPHLRIVCEDHDEVIAKVVDSDEGPAYSTYFLGSTILGAHGKGLTFAELRSLRKLVIPGGQIALIRARSRSRTRSPISLRREVQSRPGVAAVADQGVTWRFDT